MGKFAKSLWILGLFYLLPLCVWLSLVDSFGESSSATKGLLIVCGLCFAYFLGMLCLLKL